MSDSDNEIVPVDEWCAEQSLHDRRVELLAVFRFRELAAGTRNDTRAAFAFRYGRTEAAPTAA